MQQALDHIKTELMSKFGNRVQLLTTDMWQVYRLRTFTYALSDNTLIVTIGFPISLSGYGMLRLYSVEKFFGANTK